MFDRGYEYLGNKGIYGARSRVLEGSYQLRDPKLLLGQSCLHVRGMVTSSPPEGNSPPDQVYMDSLLPT